MQWGDFGGILRSSEQKFDNVEMASHDGNVQAWSAFLILLILNSNLLQQIYNLQVAMIHRVVEAIEALWVRVIDGVAQWALQDDLHYILPEKNE